MNDATGLNALYINCTLKPSPTHSHTADLMENSIAILRNAGANAEHVRAADHHIAFGVKPDMREEGRARDDWPEHIWPKVEAADILVIGTPLWLGEESSICRVIIERLYAHSAQLNDKGQAIFYNKVGGCVVTGNEDGVKHASMTVNFALNHIGYTIPPQADTGWIGEAGPGASYGDDGAGLDNTFTKKTTTFMSWNLIHMARLLKDAGGLPEYGNSVPRWNDGERFGHPDTENGQD